MDFSEEIQGEIAKAAEGLTRIADELYQVNRNNRYVRGQEEHKKQHEEEVSCTTQALAHCYKLCRYIQKSNSFNPSDFTKMSKEAERMSEEL